MKIALSFDVEEDLHSPTYKSLDEGIPRVLKILDKKNIKVTFFVPAKLLERFPPFFKKLSQQGHEIALHGYEHERFDLFTDKEQETKIDNSIKIYKKIFNKRPKGFRAPQHAIGKNTLQLLAEKKFLYDASSTPRNLLQLLSFPKRLIPNLKDFFKPKDKYLLPEKIYEIPLSSFFISFSALPLRIFSRQFLKIYTFLLKRVHKDLVLYTHSWDFIKLPKSRIDKKFPYRNLLKNLEYFIEISDKDEFVKMEDLTK
jgi:peptidoglycan/xylan/chitin deacetylase (PgdA/CDA1 family)